MNRFLSFALFLLLSVSYGQTSSASTRATHFTVDAAYSPDNSKAKSSHLPTTATLLEMTPGSVHHFRLDQENKALHSQYLLPAWTYTALFLIKDMTGRIVKTARLNPKNIQNLAIPVSDLLPGTYQYSLILNDSRKVFGSFELPE